MAVQCLRQCISLATRMMMNQDLLMEIRCLRLRYNADRKFFWDFSALIRFKRTQVLLNFDSANQDTKTTRRAPASHISAKTKSKPTGGRIGKNSMLMNSGKLGLSQRGNPFHVTTHSFGHSNSHSNRKPVGGHSTMIGFGGPSHPSMKSKPRYGGYGGYQSKKASKY